MRIIDKIPKERLKRTIREFNDTEKEVRITQNGAKDFFYSVDETLCGYVEKCKLKAKGCFGRYNGDLLQIDEKIGQIKASLTKFAGYNETVCLSCSNLAG